MHGGQFSGAAQADKGFFRRARIIKSAPQIRENVRVVRALLRGFAHVLGSGDAVTTHLTGYAVQELRVGKARSLDQYAFQDLFGQIRVPLG